MSETENSNRSQHESSEPDGDRGASEGPDQNRDQAKQGGAESIPDPSGIPEGESSEEYGGSDAGVEPGEKPVTGIPGD